MGRTIKFSITALMMGVIISSFAASAGNLGFKSIEGRVNWISISEDDSESTFGIALGSYLGQLTEVFGLEADLEFWSKTYEIGTAELSWRNISVGCNARYDFSGEGSTKFYGFGGLGFHMQKAEVDYPEAYDAYGFGSYSESSTEIGFKFGAAAEFGSGDGMVPVVRGGYCSNGGADYIFIGGGVKFPMGGE